MIKTPSSSQTTTTTKKKRTRQKHRSRERRRRVARRKGERENASETKDDDVVGRNGRDGVHRLASDEVTKTVLPPTRGGLVKADLVSSNWKSFLSKNPAVKRKPEKPLPPDEVVPTKKPTKPEIWFDDVDEIFLENNDDEEEEEATTTTGRVLPQSSRPVAAARSSSSSSSRGTAATATASSLVKPNSFVKGVTKVVAMDCEMVGVGSGGHDSILARVSLVNSHGHCVYDKYVAPTDRVTDYRTPVSGIRPENLVDGIDFKTAQQEVSDILKGRTLVGHAIHNDLQVLFLDHPRKDIRDSSKYKPFRKLMGGGTPSLKRLSERLLNVKVQEGEHNSVQDAQAAMRLYTMHRREWDQSVARSGKHHGGGGRQLPTTTFPKPSP